MKATRQAERPDRFELWGLTRNVIMCPHVGDEFGAKGSRGSLIESRSWKHHYYRIGIDTCVSDWLQVQVEASGSLCLVGRIRGCKLDASER
jgi:hypothetical protein